jgi:DNA primase
MRPYKDPDEFIKALGAEAFQERIDKAENSFMYEISVIEKKYDRKDPEESTRFEREVAEKLVEFSERFERENYLKAVCARFDISVDGMHEIVSRYGNNAGIIKKTPISIEQRQQAKKKRESGVRQAEKILLTWMIDQPEIFEKVSEYIEPADFIDPLLHDVATKLYEQFAHGTVSPAAIINTFETEEEHREVAALFSADLSTDLNRNEREKALNDTVIKVKSNSIDDALKNTKDARTMQELLVKQVKLKSLHINL